MSSAQLINTVVRQSWGEVLALLTARLRDMQFAEDMLQEAILVAVADWEDDKLPNNPKGWLYRVALNKAIDCRRHRSMSERKQAQLIIHTDMDSDSEAPDKDEGIPDERLRMIFTCCHPALEPAAQQALTLRTLCGLSNNEIARAFLVSETAMAQRLVRTRRKIKEAGIAYEIPTGEQLQSRLDSVLGVIYLIFNEGYSATTGENPIRAELCGEAIYLAGCLQALLPGQAEVHGLYALLLLHDSRRAARLDESGSLIMLADQDRSRWDEKKIRQGMATLTQASQLHCTGPYQLQAAISAVHAQSKYSGKTNWHSIVYLYDQLLALLPSRIVALNRAVAISFADGPEKGLAELQAIESTEDLRQYQPFYAALADIYYRLQNYPSAAQAYQNSIALSNNQQEREYLQRRLALCKLTLHSCSNPQWSE